jgi:hypothetical protein
LAGVLRLFLLAVRSFRQFDTADQIAALRVDVFHEVLDVAARPDVLDVTVVLVEHEDIAALIHVNDQILAVLPEQQHLIGRIVIPHILRDFLPIPFQLPGLGVERDDRIGVKFASCTAELGFEESRGSNRSIVDSMSLGDRDNRSLPLYLQRRSYLRHAEMSQATIERTPQRRQLELTRWLSQRTSFLQPIRE